MSESLPNACGEKLTLGIERLGQQQSQQTVELLLNYITLLLKWNKAYNLTAIRDPEQMIIRHVLDSLSVLPYLEDKNSPILDVGSGGGVPGIIVAICKPEQQLTLLDSNGKKTRFLQQAKTQLNLNNVEVIQSRAENYSPTDLFDRIISRAFTALDKMIQWCQPLLATEGEFLAMKGIYPEPNQQPIPQGWQVSNIQPLSVPFIDEQRHLITVARTKEF